MSRTLSLLLTLLCAAGALADVVHLRDGRKLEGRVTVEGDEVLIEQELGSVRVKADQIKTIERSADAEGETERLRRELAEGDADERYRFGVHLRERGRADEARRVFEGVLKLEPEHPGARAALGYVHHDGYWILASDHYRAQGLVEHRGEWITPAERRARVELARAEREGEESAATEAKLAELRDTIARLRAEREALRERREEVREATLEALQGYTSARAKADAWIDSAQGAWGYRNGWWGGGLGWGGFVPGWGGLPPVLPPGYLAPVRPGRPPITAPGWRPPLLPPGTRPPLGTPPVRPLQPPLPLQPPPAKGLESVPPR